MIKTNNSLPNRFSYSWRALRRDWRAGELVMVFAALVIAVSSVCAVSFFTDRIRTAIESQANTLLGGDLAIESSRPLAADFVSLAQSLGLNHATTLGMRSVVVAGDALQLSELKAVDERYPLRGTLQIADTAYGDPIETTAVPLTGTAWVEARLLNALGIEIGAAIEIGLQQFKVTNVLVIEPDRGGDLFNIAPRVMINYVDIDRTGLVMPGSRVNYRALLTGSSRQLQQYRERIEPLIDPHTRLREVRDARPEIKAALKRAEQFLSLAALSSVLVAGIAIALAAQRFAKRHLDTCAILRCLGAPQRFITQVYLLEMLWVGIVASVTGAFLGFGAQQGLVQLIGDFTATSLPAPSAWPLVSGTAIGVIALLGFSLPPLLQLRRVPPLRVLRRDLEPQRVKPFLSYASAITALLFIAPWRAGNMSLTLYVVGGGLLSLLILALAAWLLIKFLGRFRTRVGVAWRYGLANISRRPGSSVLQTAALGLGIMSLLVLTLIRTDLLAEWRNSLPAGAPNYFLINIQPQQRAELSDFLNANQLYVPDIYAMVRGRLTNINGKAIAIEDYADPRARRLFEREFNLSWSATLQSDNRITAGSWWVPATSKLDQLSVEVDIADTLQLALGDELSFQIGARSVDATVTSLREVDWETFNVNFFVIAPPGLLDDYPATFITSFHLESDQRQLLNELVSRFPSVTVIDVAAILQQVRSIMQRVSLAVQYVFGFTLAAGFIVLFAAIQATHDERLQESAVLRTLGADNKRIRQAITAELVILGLLAGTIACFCATVIGYALAVKVFDAPYQFNAVIWPLGIGLGTCGVTAAGLLGMRSILKQTPTDILRRAIH